MIQEFDLNGSGELQIKVLEAICGDAINQTMIDLCCGEAPQTGLMQFKQKTFVDCVDRRLVNEGELIISDVFDYLKNENKKYDVSISTDTVEHFRDADAINFLNLTSKVAKKQIWFTPLGEYCMTTDPNDNNPNSHKSEWTPEKLEKLMPKKWAYIVFPNWHPTLLENGLGAFFFWTAPNLKKDFQRVCNHLKSIL